MLPLRLQEVKDRLKEKGYSKRSKAEEDLLEEIEAMEKYFSQELTKFSESIRGAKLTSGPRGNCPCCGR